MDTPTRAMTMVGHIARKSVAAAGAATAALTLCAIAAAAAPTAITGPDRHRGNDRNAQRHGQPNGTATSWHFEYGDDDLRTSTSSTSAGSGTANTGVSESLTGLTPGTTYHYRLVATSTGGTTDGSDGIFNTASAAPPTVTTNAATGVGSGAATLTARSMRTARRRPTTSSTERPRRTGRRPASRTAAVTRTR